MTEIREKQYMRTVSGRKIYILDPKPEDFEIYDIAHHLSLTMRYNGGTIFPFSVARHSIIMSWMVPEEYKLEALLHDAHEMSIGDNITPLKKSCAELKAIECRHEAAMRAAFNLPPIMSDVVKEADLRMHKTETNQLRPNSHVEFDVEPYDVKLFERSWLDDRADFENLFHSLTGRKNVSAA